MRRRRATTSCDVHPAGLSTTTRPSTASPPVPWVMGSERLDDRLHHPGDGIGGREAGGEAVAAAAEQRGHGRHVHVTERAEADPHVALDLLEDAGDLGLF